MTVERAFVRLLVPSAIAVLLLVGCGRLSVYELLQGEQQGVFAMSQSSVQLVTGSQHTLSATGGFTEYRFELISGPGLLAPDTAVYTAPDSIHTGEDGPDTAEAVVRATDRLGATDFTTILIFNRFAVSPQLISLCQDGDSGPVDLELQFEGGAGGPTSVSNDLHENTVDLVNSEVVTYVPAIPGLDYVEIVDAVGNSVVVTVRIINPEHLHIDPPGAAVVTGEQVEFIVGGGSVDGGTGSYDYTVTVEPQPPGFTEGALDHLITDDEQEPWQGQPGEITFTADETEAALAPPANVAISVSDDFFTVTADVYIVDAAIEDPLQISPTDVELRFDASVELRAAGGLPPYRFEIASGAGTLRQTDFATAVFTAAASPGMTRVRVYDTLGQSAVVQIRIRR